jgi:hypothetical protein
MHQASDGFGRVEARFARADRTIEGNFCGGSGREAAA